MTLCIAAKCMYNDQAAIIMSSDRRIEDGISGSEIAHKQGRFPNGWRYLYAGVQARAAELVISVREYLEQTPELATKFTAPLKQAVRRHREKLADEYVHSQIARSYEWLLQEGRESLPPEYFAQLISSIAHLRLEAELAVCGFVDSDAVIAVIDDSRGEPITRPVEHFAAIGSGAVLAESALHYRSHTMAAPLKQALYHVYEAQRLGQAAPGVGRELTITILLADGRIAYVTGSGATCIENYYSQYAPKPLVKSEEWEYCPAEFIDFRQDEQYLESTTDGPSPRQPLLESPGG